MKNTAKTRFSLDLAMYGGNEWLDARDAVAEWAKGGDNREIYTSRVAFYAWNRAWRSDLGATGPGPP